MALSPIQSIAFFSRPDNTRALVWKRKIRTHLKQKHPKIRILTQGSNPDLLIVLGGDGTILQIAREGSAEAPLIFGMNLGTVGFLASVREERSFLKALTTVLAGRYRTVRRMMLDVEVRRGKRTLIRTTALNEVYVQNPLGMVGLDIRVGKTLIQRVQGTGVLIATPTGSTGYNLSAHGPIIDPSLECLIVTEVLDHSLPTPSIVIPAQDEVELHVVNFRERGLLSLSTSAMPVDVLMGTDGQDVLALAKKDIVIVRKAGRAITTVEIEHNYFYKSLHEKFSLT